MVGGNFLNQRRILLRIAPANLHEKHCFFEFGDEAGWSADVPCPRGGHAPPPGCGPGGGGGGLTVRLQPGGGRTWSRRGSHFSASQAALYPSPVTTPDGASPAARMILGGDGNFYGTTTTGGIFGAGIVFSLSPNGTLTDLYDFQRRRGTRRPARSSTSA